MDIIKEEVLLHKIFAGAKFSTESYVKINNQPTQPPAAIPAAPPIVNGLVTGLMGPNNYKTNLLNSGMGQFILLEEVQVEIPDGTYFKFPNNSCSVYRFGHNNYKNGSISNPEFNGTLELKKKTIYTTVQGTGIADSLKLKQKFIFEKGTKILIKKGTKCQANIDHNNDGFFINIILDQDTEAILDV